MGNEVIKMAWSPIAVGDGESSYHTFTTDSGIYSLVGLQNTALSLHLVDTSNSTLYICTGAWTITNAASGLATFTPSAADLLSTNPFGKPGLYRAYPVVSLSTGPKAMDPQILDVLNN